MFGLPPHGHPDRGAWKQGIVPTGPISQLLYSAAQFAVVIDKDLLCHQYREVPFHILNTPFQFLAGVTRRFILSSRTAVACTKRTDLKSASNIDFELLSPARSHFDKHNTEEDRRILFWQLSLSGWSDHKLQQIGRQADKPCECGHPKPDWLHAIWDCPLNDEARFEDPVIRELCKLRLPDAVKRGLPIPIRGNPAGTLFHSDSMPFNAHDTHSCTVIEFATAVESKWRVNQDFNAGYQFYVRMVDAYPFLATYTAQQFFSHFRGSFLDGDLLPPPIVEQLVNDEPADCNSFTDGSLINPTKQPWCLGGSALWWANRDFEAHPLTDVERDFCSRAKVADGYAFYLHVPGQFGSSTRTEIVPGILSMYNTMQVKMGADSANYIRMANKIIADPLYKPPKPWGLMHNGDLWAVFQKTRQLRVGGLWPISKIKAHTEEADIEKGIITEYHRTSNGHADTYARTGVGSHNEGLAQLAYAYSSVDRVCLEVLSHIHSMIVRVFKASEARRQLQLKRSWATGGVRGSSPLIVPRLPACPTSTGDQHNFTLLKPNPQLVEQGGLAFCNVWCFLSHIKLQPVVFPQQGVSWIELFCLFELLGGKLQHDLSAAAAARPSLRALLAIFKKSIREVVSTCLSPGDRALFAPSTRPDLRLQTVGFTNFCVLHPGSLNCES